MVNAEILEDEVNWSRLLTGRERSVIPLSNGTLKTRGCVGSFRQFFVKQVEKKRIIFQPSLFKVWKMYNLDFDPRESVPFKNLYFIDS